MSPQLDLFAHPCGHCRHLAAERLVSGIAYCLRFCVWRWPALAVECGGFQA